MEAKTVDVSRGLSWLSCGWRIFTKTPWVWIMLGLVFPALMFVLAPIPLGTLVFALLVPPLVAGLLAAARDAEAGRALTFAHLFLAFRDKTRLTPLLVLGGVALAGVLASSGAAFMVAGNELLEMMATMRGGMRAGTEFAPAPPRPGAGAAPSGVSRARTGPCSCNRACPRTPAGARSSRA